MDAYEPDPGRDEADWSPDPTRLPRVLGLDEALARGFSRHAIEHRLAIRRWRRLLPRTYLTSDICTWDDRLRAASTFAGPDGLISGAAALVDEVRAVRRPSSVLVLVPATVGTRSIGWVQVRPVAHFPDRWPMPGPGRACVERAVADLAVQLRRVDDVRAVVAEVVRRGLCSADELDVARRAGPRRGSKFLRLAIEEVAAGAWSAPEARAARALRDGGVPPFVQNARIELPGGRWLVADFLWPELRAILEIDSIEHHFTPADLDATHDRHVALETLGYSTIHRSPALVYRDPHRFVAEVSAWLTGCAARRAA